MFTESLKKSLPQINVCNQTISHPTDDGQLGLFTSKFTRNPFPSLVSKLQKTYKWHTEFEEDYVPKSRMTNY